MTIADPASVAVLALLDSERAALLARVDSVPDSLREQRPAEGGWCVDEVLEHLATVERGIVRLLQTRLENRSSAAPAAEVSAASRLDPARITRLRDRTTRMEAPDRVKPRGLLRTPEALHALGETRASLKAALIASDASLLDGETHAHPILGTLTLRGWAEFVAHHEARHAEQIGAIQRSLLTTRNSTDR